MTWLCLVLPASLLGLLAVMRYRHGHTLRAWADVLDPARETIYRHMQTQYDNDAWVATDAWARAQAAHERAEVQEAIRQMEVALFVVSDTTPTRMQRLREMGSVLRMVSAVLPLPPVWPSAFTMGRTRGLARIGVAVDAFLVGPAERLVLRARIIVAVYRVLVWTMRRARSREAFERFGAALGDWAVAGREDLQTIRQALVAMRGQ